MTKQKDTNKNLKNKKYQSNIIPTGQITWLQNSKTESKLFFSKM